MWAAFPSASLWMTVPSVSSDLLMKEPSMRCLLWISAFADSEPARSIRFSREKVRRPRKEGSALAPGRSRASMDRRMMVWEREEPSLKAVAAV